MIKWIFPEGEEERQEEEVAALQKVLQRDRALLRQFYRLQQEGVPFEAMPEEVRVWWMERY